VRVLKGFGLTLLIIGQLWLSSVVYGGGGSVEDMPQQQMALQEEGTGNDWVVPVVVAGLGAAGTLGAAVIMVRRRKN